MVGLSAEEPSVFLNSVEINRIDIKWHLILHTLSRKLHVRFAKKPEVNSEFID
jgi:hypothetical protein